MHKLTKAATIVGLVTAFATSASQAAYIAYVPKLQPSDAAVANDPDCTAVMGHMRTPKAAEILNLVAQHIAVIPVCEDLTVPGRNNYGPLFVNGNAELLRLPIARNRALVNALRAESYDHHDVVSVRFGGEHSVILYVHQRDMN